MRWRFSGTSTPFWGIGVPGDGEEVLLQLEYPRQIEHLNKGRANNYIRFWKKD